MAAYYQLPIGNLCAGANLGNPNYTLTLTIDVQYARALWAQNWVIWATPASVPDLGGKQLDDARLSNGDYFELGKASSTLFNEECMSTGVCCDVAIGALAINAIIQSVNIEDVTTTCFGANTLSVDQMLISSNNENMIRNSRNGRQLDEAMLIAPVIRILREMLIEWLKAVRMKRQASAQFADSLLAHFYNYVLGNCDSSAKSLLYEPALKKYLHQLMSKLIFKLVAEWRQLGAHIIHASHTRLIIDTMRYSLEEANEYVDMAFKRLSRNQLFAGLNMNKTRIWMHLLWIDERNYAGVRMMKVDAQPIASLSPEKKRSRRVLDEGDESSNASTLQKCKPTCDVNFAIAAFLPNKISADNLRVDCQELFENIIAGYVMMVYNSVFDSKKIIDDEPPNLNESIFDIGNASQSSDCEKENRDVYLVETKSSETMLDRDPVQARVNKYCQHLVEHELTQQLLDTISFVHRKLGTGHRGTAVVDNDDDELTTMKNVYSTVFPHLPGSHNRIHLVSPALSLVNAITRILAVHRTIEAQVMVLRREMLRIINIDEFSSVAEWKDPCLSYILPEVMCNTCNTCRDVDIGRDAIEVDSDTYRIKPYRCWHCGKAYDLEMIEQRLLEATERVNVACVVQDTRCSKCKMVKQYNMNAQCECSHSFTNVISSNEIRSRLLCFHNIAIYFDMKLLVETTKWLLKNRLL